MSSPARHFVRAILVALAFLVLETSPTVSPVWYGPYLSAARNVQWGGQFLINLEEIQKFSEMPPEQRRGYRFTRTDSLQPYAANPIGFVYVVAVATALLPWLSDSEAIKYLQLLVHVVLCVLVMELLGSPTQRAAFFVLYAANPLVIYFVANPIYFFWQSIPSFALVFLMLVREQRNYYVAAGPLWKAGIVVLSALLGLMLLVRLTMVGAIAAFFLLSMLWLRDKRLLLAGIAAFALVTISGYTPNQKNFWHTPYVGIGAYPNPHVEGLSDNNGYAMFERKTGVPFHASLGGPYYDDAIMAHYTETTKAEYLRLLRADWPRLVWHAALNMSAGFSIGYLVGWDPWAHYLAAASGLLIIVLLLYTRQVLLVGLIALTNATFALYFPPIPAYMYGSYLLLVIGMLNAAERLGVISRIDRWWTRIVSAASPAETVVGGPTDR